VLGSRPAEGSCADARSLRPGVCSCARAQALAVAGLVLVASGLSGRQPAAASALMQVNQALMMRQRGARPQSLFGGWSTVTPEQFDGRCRCTGYKTYDPDQRVVCACTGLPGGNNKDLWRKGPWKILTGCAFALLPSSRCPSQPPDAIAGCCFIIAVKLLLYVS